MVRETEGKVMSHYKLNISDDFKVTMEIEAEYVSKLYSQLIDGIDQQIIDNMPPQAVRKLLSQLLARYSQVVGMDINADMDEISCVYALREQLDKRGV